MILKSVTYTPFKAPGELMFGNVPGENWQKIYPADNEGLCLWALRSLLIDDGSNVVLIDTGFSNNNLNIIEEYKVENFIPAHKVVDYHKKVTIVLNTHLHVDHCGGNFIKMNNRFKPAFPDALYYLADSQLSTAKHPILFEKESFQPEIIDAFSSYEGLKLIKENCFLLPWLELRIFNGHTKGLIMPIIHLKNWIIAFVGDLIPSMAHLSLNSISCYDIDPILSESERNEFLNEAFEKNFILFFQHDINFECCTLDINASKFEPSKVFSVLDLKLNL